MLNSLSLGAVFRKIRRFGLATLVAAVVIQAAGQAQEKQDPVATATHSALTKNITHAREWLDQKYYKSVAQSAGGLQLLAEILHRRGQNAAWRQATEKLIAAARDVQAAARDENAAQCRAALDGLEKLANAAISIAP